VDGTVVTYPKFAKTSDAETVTSQRGEPLRTAA
jgi:hypothetical protein